jgi:hypothetical protein
MFGVGVNPTYLRRQKERQERKQRSGAAARELADVQRASAIDTIYSDGEYAGADTAAAGAATGAAGAPADVETAADGRAVDDALDALFDTGYSFDE